MNFLIMQYTANIKAKLFMCFVKHYAVKMGSESVAPHILNLGTK